MALTGLAAWRLAPAAAAAAATGSCRRLPALCRAVGSKAAKPAEPETVYCFERAPDEPPAFPELLQPGRRVLLLAVDPDLGGAVAALSWHNPPAAAAEATATHPGSSGGSSESSSGSSSESGVGSSSTGSSSSNSSEVPPLPLQVPPPLPLLEAVHVELHDMPIEVWKYGSRDKRQPEAAGLIRILQRYLGLPGAGAFGDGGIGSISSSTSSGEGSSGKKKRSSKAAGSASKGAVAAPAVAEALQAAQPAASTSAADQQQQHQEGQQEEPALVRAVVEYSLPPAVSGKFAWYGIGFAVGLLNGLLVGQGIAYRRVPSSTWKQQMGLKKQGKEGSIALARHLLPAAAGMLKRKKDHGRAEALLMAAWGLGVRMHPIAPISSSMEGAATDTDGEAALEDEDEAEDEDEVEDEVEET